MNVSLYATLKGCSSAHISFNDVNVIERAKEIAKQYGCEFNSHIEESPICTSADLFDIESVGNVFFHNGNHTEALKDFLSI